MRKYLILAVATLAFTGLSAQEEVSSAEDSIATTTVETSSDESVN